VIAAGTTTSVRNTFVEYRAEDGTTGWGEHAPSERVTGESLGDVRAEIIQLLRNPSWVDRLLEDVTHLPGGVPRAGARNALTCAWLDAEGRRQGEPGHRLLNMPDGRVASSITITIDEPAAAGRMAQTYADAGWGAFKIKMGGQRDAEVLKAVRDRFPHAPIRVDANEGWTLKQAEEMLPVLHRHEVELLEQPLPRSDWNGLSHLVAKAEVPIFLDESVLDTDTLLTAIQKVAGDGVVIKLSKCGGPFEARRMIKVAREHGWKIMVGCMIESGAGIAAGALLAGAVDYADLDGAALLADDPFTGPLIAKGKIGTPDGHGLGVNIRPEALAEFNPIEPD
jgi:L-Ala-D/L-Glu epimerase